MDPTGYLIRGPEFSDCSVAVLNTHTWYVTHTRLSSFPRAAAFDLLQIRNWLYQSTSTNSTQPLKPSQMAEVVKMFSRLWRARVEACFGPAISPRLLLDPPPHPLLSCRPRSACAATRHTHSRRTALTVNTALRALSALLKLVGETAVPTTDTVALLGELLSPLPEAPPGSGAALGRLLARRRRARTSPRAARWAARCSARARRAAPAPRRPRGPRRRRAAPWLIHHISHRRGCDSRGRRPGGRQRFGPTDSPGLPLRRSATLC